MHYHIVSHGQMSHNALAQAKQSHDWRIFADFVPTLIPTAQRRYTNDWTLVPGLKSN